MFYSILFKTEKGLFCKNPDGKIYFPADRGGTAEIPQYNKEEFEAGDVVKCDTVHDKERYGFVVMKKVQTEYPETSGTDTIFYNGQKDRFGISNSAIQGFLNFRVDKNHPGCLIQKQIPGPHSQRF